MVCDLCVVCVLRGSAVHRQCVYSLLRSKDSIQQHDPLVKLSRRTINKQSNLVACGVVAGEASVAADGCSRSGCEKGRSKVLSGCFTSTGQIDISGVNKMDCRINHVRGPVVSGNHLIVLRP